MKLFLLLGLLLSGTVSSGGRSVDFGGKEGCGPEQACEGKSFLLLEEARERQFIGELRLDQDPGDGSMSYILSGEGADDVFTMDPHTGDLVATRPLDREEKAVHSLSYTVTDRRTDQVVQPETAITVVLKDINDHAPVFSQESYVAAVPERSQWGTSVVRVAATDPDEGMNAKIFYDIRGGNRYFSVDHETGLVRTAAIFPDELDREQIDSHQLVVVAMDRAGRSGGLTGTTEVFVTLTDVNDSPPRFVQDVYEFHVPESIEPGSSVGRVRAADPDVGQNAEMKFSIVGGNSMDVFEVSTDENTQEGVIRVREPLDYETRSSYRVHVGVVNAKVPPELEPLHTPDHALVEIMVQDEAEAPIFEKALYRMEVKEDAAVGTVVGSVHASDPDGAQGTVKYFNNWDADHKFNVDGASGTITVVGSLDREEAACHKISVSAAKLDGALVSHATVNICLLDVNDNAPVLDMQGAPFVCEGVQAAGQLIQTVSAVDLDDPPSGDMFFFSMAADAKTSLFTVRDNGASRINQLLTFSVPDNTADILTRQATFDRSRQDVHLVPVVVSDGDIPMQWSTGTVTVTVCSCNHEGHCSSAALSWNLVTLTWSAVALIWFLIGALGVVLVKTLKKKPAPAVVQPPLRRRGGLS
ncbi:cadherin-6-like [Neosynchiropus ocellatus]